jgi:hypothetical protein
MAASDFSINKFKANLQYGGARPSLFQVLFQYPNGISDPPTRTTPFLVKATTIPASTIGSYDVYYHGKAIKVAGDRSFDTWDTTIFNDEDFSIRNALENWMAGISNHTLNTRDKEVFNTSEGDTAKYKTTLQVTQFGKAGTELRTYIFKGAWPSALSTINLDWSTASEIEEFTCTWVYDSWYVAGTATSSSSNLPADTVVNAPSTTGDLGTGTVS